MKLIKYPACGFFSILLLASSHLNAENVLQKNESSAQSNLSAAKASQQKVDKAYEAQRDALHQYRLTKTEIDQLSIYNNQLQKIVLNQNTQIDSLKNQIKEIEITQQGIMPLMERMLNGLQQFIELDTPFLIKEREERVANLRGLLLSAEVTVSEKFRRVLEAYQIEVEYGRTIEAYRAENDKQQMVDYLRVGRVALYYLPLDGVGAQVWNIKEKNWHSLDSDYDRSILKGIRIARKQSAPSLLNLQLPGLGKTK
jgi:hypothetical protein